MNNHEGWDSDTDLDRYLVSAMFPHPDDEGSHGDLPDHYNGYRVTIIGSLAVFLMLLLIVSILLIRGSS